MRWLVGLGFFGALAAGAHEIGTTRVTVAFPADGSYAIEVVTDRAALAEKLAAAGGGQDVFPGRVRLAFDGVAVRPAFSFGGTGTETTVRLTGVYPAGAKRFTWKYGWTFASYALSVGGGETVWMEGGEESAPLAVLPMAAPVSRWRVVGQYLALGFTHIVPYGFDHVLFVLGIYLLSNRRRTVLLQVTAFTVAHSITLGLNMYGLVRVPAAVVEPMIAISIGYVAIENLFLSELRPWRVGLVFVFGLLHGMGFAGVLTELGLPRGEFVTALVAFNAGVEMGQLAVIGTAFLLVGRWCAERSWYRARVVVPASAMIACAAVYWTVERVTGWGIL